MDRKYYGSLIQIQTNKMADKSKARFELKKSVFIKRKTKIKKQKQGKQDMSIKFCWSTGCREGL